MIPPGGGALQRLPIWLKLGIPLTVLLLGLAVLAALRILQEEIPAYGQVPAVQERFPEQLAFLLEMAESLPEHRCGEESPLDTITLLEPWWERLGSGEELLSDPAILGAEVLRFCGDGRQVGYGVKEYQGPQGAWSRSIFFPSGEYPSVTLWRRGARRLIRYQDRQQAASGDVNGIRLTLDLEKLQPDGASADPLPGAEPAH
jgi:hypothetical protein